MKRYDRNARDKQAIEQHLQKSGGGDVRIARVASVSPIGPSGPTMAVDHGGGRITTGVAGDARGYAPGTGVMDTRAGRGRSSQATGLAPRHFQSNEPEQSGVYDPVGGFYL